MDHKDLACSEICAIIEACGKFGVGKLGYRDLQIEFGQAIIPEPRKNQIDNPDTAISADNHDRINKETLEDEEAKLREEELAFAMVEDPALYEQMLRDGELTDDNDKLDEQQQ